MKLLNKLFGKKKKTPEIVCVICGGTNITITKHKKITIPPKCAKKILFEYTTYGYCYNKYVCECSNTWERIINL